MKRKLTISTVTNIVICIIMVIIFAYPLLLNSKHYLSCYEDDFYYYLKIGINFIDLGFPTYDGEIPTNGYHPLWFLIVTCLIAIFGKGKLFFLGFNITIVTLNLVSLRLIRKILNFNFMNPVYIEIATIVSMYLVVNLSITGMEVVLTTPLLLYLICYFQEQYNKLNYYKLSLLLSTIILSRVDTGLFVVIFLCSMFISKKITIKDFNKLSVGFLPVIIYLIINNTYFDSMLPVSGLAKQIRVEYVPNYQVLKELYIGNISSIFLHFVPYIFVPILLFSKYNYKKIQIKKEISYSFTFFSIIYFPLLSILSGWKFWNWYFYPFLFLNIFLLVFIYNQEHVKKYLLKYAYISYTIVTTYFLFYTINYKFIKETNPFYLEMIDLSEFINSHPGKYGVGDKAGLLGYLAKYSIFQLEGLVEDKHYLENIRNSVNLKHIFVSYKLDYYISYNLHYDYKIMKYIAKEPAAGYEYRNKYMSTFMNFELEYKSNKFSDIYYVYNLNKPIK